MTDQAERLSSSRTFYLKFVFTPTWIIGWCSLLLLHAFGVSPILDRYTREPVSGFTLAATIGFLLGSCAYFYWKNGRLKKVVLDGGSLVISNFLREVRVPLGQIEEISQLHRGKEPPIVIRFSGTTDFGSRIIFVPKRNHRRTADSSVVERLRVLRTTSGQRC